MEITWLEASLLPRSLPRAIAYIITSGEEVIEYDGVNPEHVR